LFRSCFFQARDGRQAAVFIKHAGRCPQEYKNNQQENKYDYQVGKQVYETWPGIGSFAKSYV
jgi:hypothetical protein